MYTRLVARRLCLADQLWAQAWASVLTMQEVLVVVWHTVLQDINTEQAAKSQNKLLNILATCSCSVLQSSAVTFLQSSRWEGNTICCIIGGVRPLKQFTHREICPVKYKAANPIVFLHLPFKTISAAADFTCKRTMSSESHHSKTLKATIRHIFQE